MASLNTVSLIGRLGKDPEHKTTANSELCSFSVATTESYTKDSKTVETTEWHNVVVWGKLAGIAAQYLRKGSLCYIQGKLQTQKYTNKQGAEAYSTKIVANVIQFLEKKSQEQKPAEIEPFQPMSDFDIASIPF